MSLPPSETGESTSISFNPDRQLSLLLISWAKHVLSHTQTANYKRARPSHKPKETSKGSHVKKKIKCKIKLLLPGGTRSQRASRLTAPKRHGRRLERA